MVLTVFTVLGLGFNVALEVFKGPPDLSDEARARGLYQGL